MRLSMRFLSLALLVATAIGCQNRTYVLVTVEASPGLEGLITQLRFHSDLKRGAEVLITDDRSYPDKPRVIAFPNSFVIVADHRGNDGEVVEVYVEGLDNNGQVIARARGTALVVPDKESSVQVVLGSPCTGTADCLSGQAFCSAPSVCNCEGAACEQGYCEEIPLDDGNTCTVVACDEEAQTVEQLPINDGTECAGPGGQTLTCAGGFCGCGDGVTNPDIEECDEGEANANEPNRCRAIPACTRPYCGDGIVDDEFGEECDDGDANSFAPDACRPDCKLPSCGDFVVDSSEECDEGNPAQGGLNSDTAALACRTNCKLPSCGDGVIDSGGFAFGVYFDEECDDAAANDNGAPGACRQEVVTENGTGTRHECRRAFCGDGVIDSGERCDDNNSTNNDGCNPTCSLFGSITLVAGQAGGAGSADATGTDAWIRSVHSIELAGGFFYFTTDGSSGESRERNKAIRRFHPSTGVVETVAGLDGKGDFADAVGTGARFSSPRGLSSDGTYIYIADTNNQRLRRMHLQNLTVETVAGTGGTGSTDGNRLTTATFNKPTFVAARSSTEILVMDQGDGSTGCFLRLVDLSTDEVTTLAGNDAFSCLFPWDDTGTLASFGEITGIVMGTDGYLYVADTNTIRKVDIDTGAVTTVAGQAFVTGEINATPGTSAAFDRLGRLAAASGELYVADEGNGAIRVFDLATTGVTTLADDGSIVQPVALGVTGTGLVFSRLGSSLIYASDLASPPLTPAVFIGNAPTAGSSDGDATVASFDKPTAIAIADGSLFVAERDTGTLRLIDMSLPNMPVSTPDWLPGGTNKVANLVASNNVLYATVDTGNYYLYEYNATTGAELQSVLIPGLPPRGLAIAGGFAYLAFPSQHVVRRIDLSNFVEDPTPYAGRSGVNGFGDGPVNEALFTSPYALTECGGNLYVAETGNKDAEVAEEAHVIRKIDLGTGIVSTVAGSPGIRGSQDGFGTAARFDSPEGIACDPPGPGYPGNLYVADRGGDVIRQLRLDTLEVSTLTGSAYQKGAVDGQNGAARLAAPEGLVFDSTTGDLFVTDRDGNVVRRIQ